MPKLISFVRLVDNINDNLGKLFSFLLLPLTAIATTEVVLRYIFNRPTIWAWDINQQLLGALIVVGGGYAFLHNMHVRVDIVVTHLTSRARALIELFTSPLFFFAYGILLWQSSVAAYDSVKMKEHYTSIFAPPIYPLKVLTAIAIFLLLCQGIAILIRNLFIVVYGEMGGKR